MEIKLKADEGKRIEVEFQQTDLTIPDLVASELLKMNDVEFAGVAKDHPEIGKPVLIIKSKKKKAAEDLESALQSIEENVTQLKESFGAAKKR